MKTNPNKETKNQPVSLAPFTSKMFEKVLYVQIKKLTKNNQTHQNSAVLETNYSTQNPPEKLFKN